VAFTNTRRHRLAIIRAGVHPMRRRMALPIIPTIEGNGNGTAHNNLQENANRQLFPVSRARPTQSRPRTDPAIENHTQGARRLMPKKTPHSTAHGVVTFLAQAAPSHVSACQGHPQRQRATGRNPQTQCPEKTW